jgi:hypothetical protein
VTNYKRNYDIQVDTWDEMKSLTRRRFVPDHYYREFAFFLFFIVTYSYIHQEISFELKVLVCIKVEKQVSISFLIVILD